MNRRLLVTDPTDPDVTLESITSDDLESLRQWKNANRQSFFFKSILAADDQLRWFSDYLERRDDYMFTVRSGGIAVGCMGFRYIDCKIDVYNVILGLPELGGRGLMSRGLRLLCTYAGQQYSGPISLKVLKVNSALDWYVRNGFQEVAAFDDHLELQRDRSGLVICQVVEVPDWVARQECI